MTPLTCPSCDRPAPDGLLCGACTKRLRGDLGELPDLLAELDVQVSRQSVQGAAGGKRSSEEPMPFDWDSADQMWAIRNTLHTWVMTIELGDIDDLDNDPAAWCQWLTRRIERIRGHAEAGDLCDEISYCVKAARTAIDLPGDGIFCGTCDVCSRELYAPREAAEVVCRYCSWAGIEANYPTAGRRQDMKSKAEEIAVLPKAQILDVAPGFNLVINPSTFRAWTSRGQLVPVGDRRGVPLYRLGDALNLQRAANAAAKAAEKAQQNQQTEQAKEAS